MGSLPRAFPCPSSRSCMGLAPSSPPHLRRCRRRPDSGAADLGCGLRWFAGAFCLALLAAGKAPPMTAKGDSACEKSRVSGYHFFRFLPYNSPCAGNPTLDLTRQSRSLSMSKIFAFLRDESGATAIEYGLIAALISVVIITAVKTVGTNLRSEERRVGKGVKHGRAWVIKTDHSCG